MIAKWRFFWLALSLLAVVALVPFGVANAENLGPGGGTRVAVGDQVIGAYRVLVTTSPEPAQVGQLTVVVRVTDPSTGEFLRDAQVSVALLNPENGAKLTQTATHQNAGNAVDYAAHLQVEQPGTWQATVRVNGAQGSAEVSFDQRITAPRGASTVFLVGLPFLVVLGVAAGVWYKRAGLRAAPAG